MSENTTKAACTQREWEMARDAGLPIWTTADEVAIAKFAAAIRAEFNHEVLERLWDVLQGLEGVELPGAMPTRVEKLRAAADKATGTSS